MLQTAQTLIPQQGKVRGAISHVRVGYDLGDWHIVVLNSECNGTTYDYVGCDHDQQKNWLVSDLAGNTQLCTAAYFHRPVKDMGGTHQDDTGSFNAPNSTGQSRNVWTDYSYDAADRLTSEVNKKTGPVTISSYTYTVDAAGNRTQVEDLSGTQNYQYDALYRLTQATYPGPQTDTYSYDPNGNRLTKNATSYAYDATDQMTTAGGVTYGYDYNGNQTTRSVDTFTYDHENRLTQAVIGGATSSSVYNGDGLRMSRTVGAQTTSYTWDVAAGLPVVLQDGTNTYVYGLDLISVTDTGGAQTYFLYDGLGSTTGLTDGSGNNAVSYSYDVFGAIRT